MTLNYHLINMDEMIFFFFQTLPLTTNQNLKIGNYISPPQYIISTLTPPLKI
jgi:hypothetical protein